jgi:glucose-1-phosphate adenylyltransferase
VLTAVRPRLPARILGSARVDDSLVCAGCMVAGDVARSVLGPGVVVEAGAVVRDSVLLGDVTVRRGARVGFAIVDDEVEVGEGAAVGAVDHAAPAERPPITVVGRRARVDAGARVNAGDALDADAAPRPRAARGGTLER